MQAHFQRLIQSLAERVLVAVQASESDTRILVDFEDFPMLIDHLTNARQVLLAASVAALPENNREAIYRELLQGQFLFQDTAGGTLSVDPDARFIGLAIVKDDETLTPENFPTLVENFLHVATFWRDKINELAEAPAPGEEKPAPTPEAFGAGPMMRV